MSWFETLQIVVNCIGIAILVITVWVYNGRLRTMRDQLATAYRQLEISQKGAEGQNILALANFLQADEIRDAREHVINNLEGLAYGDWLDEDKRMASKVCSNYGVAGVILKSDLMPVKPFLENWRSSIKRSYKILRPHIREMQKPGNGGPDYWSTFDWLHLQVITKYPNDVV